MRKYKNIEVQSRQLTELRCDVCGVDIFQDELEMQEAFFLYKVGGYNSVFGDGREIDIDICQYCLKDKLGEYCTVT